MKKGKVSKYFIDIIVFIIGFNVADFVISSLGIKYEKILSLEFGLTILIATTILCIFEFIINRTVSLLYKNKN
jgi:Na+-translocating ferredoxin:NAD+ oxidoreductase RnfA subunit